jgi:hypothetical protein
MKKLVFTTEIAATREKIWDTLWEDATYRQWTRVFSPTSSAESDWNEGSKIIFHDGNGNGMFSVIETKKEPFEMVFRHLGSIKNDVEEPFPEGSGWTDSLEKYTLGGEDGAVLLTAEVESPSEYEEFFAKTFPEALAIIKELAEKS